MEIRLPSKAVLTKYGLSLDEWKLIWDLQGQQCPICNKKPKTGTPTEFNIDHAHFPGWKKMPPAERRKYVRGIICQWCNRSYLAKGMTLVKAQNLVTYFTNLTRDI